MELTAEIVRELLDCDIATGKMVWKERDSKWFPETGIGGAQGNCKRWNGNNAGKAAARLNRSNGYWLITILKKEYKAHRIIWLWRYGKWPENNIDHLDGNKSNNSIDNLSDKTQAQNNKNRKTSCTNTSGYPGVSWNKQSRKWRAQIKINSQKIYLGSFATPEEAYSVFAAKARESGFTERHISIHFSDSS